MNKLGPEARAIVEAGRHGDDPTADDRSRVRASVMHAMAAGGVGVAAALAGKAAAASVAPKAAAGAAAVTTTAATLGGAALGAKLLAVVVLASAVGGGAYAWTRQSPHAGLEAGRPAALSSVTTQSTAATATPASPVPAEQPATPPAAPEGAPPLAQANVEPAPARAAPPRALPSNAATADPLEAEARRLRAAHDAIQAGDPERALADLDAQGRAYPSGQLGEERDATRVLALCKAGRVSEAKAAAARFIAEHPRSPHVDRLRTPCAEGQ